MSATEAPAFLVARHALRPAEPAPRMATSTARGCWFTMRSFLKTASHGVRFDDVGAEGVGTDDWVQVPWVPMAWVPMTWAPIAWVPLAFVSLTALTRRSLEPACARR